MDSLTTALKVVPAIFVALFPIVNPIGTALVLYQMTGHIDQKAWIAASRKIALNVFLLLSAFLLFGGAILKFFGVSIPLVQLSGGLVVASIGWGLLNREETEPTSDDHATHATGSLEHKLFYPYTFPTTVGPGSLAVAMTFGAHVDRSPQLHATMQIVGGIAGILATAVVTGVCYARLKWITERFSPAGVQALSRILAFFLFCIGVGIAWDGWSALNAQVAAGGG
jgi:multiple antibiotic resistance protein